MQRRHYRNRNTVAPGSAGFSRQYLGAPTLVGNTWERHAGSADTRSADFSRHKEMHTKVCAPRDNSPHSKRSKAQSPDQCNSLNIFSEDPEFLGWHFRGYLPHLDAPNLHQFVTFRLYDALPRSLLRRWQQELRTLKPKQRQWIFQQRITKFEDQGYGSCYLAHPAVAQIVQEELLRENGTKYHLKAWCIMPNHVHVLLQVKHAPLSEIIRQWKGRSALRANRYLQRRGTFWFKEYFDRYIRNQRHYAAVVRYIRDNPVRAGLVEDPEQWQWSYWNEDEIRI